MSYRVDTVPWPVRPIYLVLTWALGFILYFYCLLCRVTSRISIEGPGNRDLSQHAIFCIWHESWWTYFVAFFHHAQAHALITHPAAYMKPMHTVLHLMGLKRLLLGSSGEEGKQAVNQLARMVQAGCSTTISPDGPAGPPRILKKGVLHIAMQTGVPIVPLTISADRFISWPSWDGKKLPLPFNRIRIIVHEAVVCLSQQSFETTSTQIVNALGGP